MKFKIILIFLFCALTMASCRSKKGLAGKVDTQSVEYLEQKLEENQFVPEWISGKIKAKYYRNGEKQQGVIIDFRMQKDKVIWMSVSPNIGIKLEVGRAIITPDRIQVMDKINKYHYDKPFKYINEYIDYPVSFQDLQNALLGNALMTDGFESVDLENEKYSMFQEGMMLMLNADYSVAAMKMEDPGKGLIAGELAEYEKLESGANFPKLRHYEMISPTETHAVTTTFSKISLEGPLNLPFKVSSRYERVD